MLDIVSSIEDVGSIHNSFSRGAAVVNEDNSIEALDLSLTSQRFSFETPFEPIVIIDEYGVDFGLVGDYPKTRHLCRVCWREFENDEKRQWHERRHTLKRNYQCELCPKSFTHCSNLRRHYKCHANERPFKCDICTKKFSRKCDLGIHQRIHSGEQPFTCPICSKKFTYTSNLNAHIRIHNDGKPFICLKCNGRKSFNQLRYLKRHMKIHLKNTT